MTYQEFKNKYNGKFLDYDNQFGAQCWDLAVTYFVECLKVPDSVLGGCKLVSNMLVEPKLSLMLKYFDEVKTTEMCEGDVAIWDEPMPHIAIFDHWDGKQNYYFTQNPNACLVQPIMSNAIVRAFRIKGSKYSKKPTTEQPQSTPTTLKYKIGDKVVINGGLYYSPSDADPLNVVQGVVTYITRTAPGTKHPYNTTGDLGWMNEADIQLYKEPKEVIKYTVKNGDVLNQIASKFGVTWQSIYEANKSVIGANPDLVIPGQVLTIVKKK